MDSTTANYRRHRFPPEIMSHAVWLYHRFCLSFRDVEDLLAERGVAVSCESIRHCCRKSGTGYARRLKRRADFFDRLLAPLPGVPTDAPR
jgi:putative transposase